MKNFTDLTEQELIELQQQCTDELSRIHDTKTKKPIPLDNISFDELMNVCILIVDDIDNNKFQRDDNEYYVYAAAMEVIYGKDIHARLNAICSD